MAYYKTEQNITVTLKGQILVLTKTMANILLDINDYGYLHITFSSSHKVVFSVWKDKIVADQLNISEFWV